uniref:Si:dkey-174m14.3 n=1 Tax=Macrostomum lignano TaxID=282301 RepID=A0A1I8FHL5_9PLAT
ISLQEKHLAERQATTGTTRQSDRYTGAEEADFTEPGDCDSEEPKYIRQGRGGPARHAESRQATSASHFA